MVMAWLSLGPTELECQLCHPHGMQVAHLRGENVAEFIPSHNAADTVHINLEAEIKHLRRVDLLLGCLPELSIKHQVDVSLRKST